MRVAVVINASAGGVLGRVQAVGEVLARLQSAGLAPVVEPDDGRSLSARIASAMGDADVLAVGGGDGTIACAAQLLAGTGVALGILPLGTMNLLARDLGLPPHPAAAIDCLVAGHTREIDVGEVNGHVFLVNSALGALSRLARLRERKRGAMGLADCWRILLAGVRECTVYPPLHVDIDPGGGMRRIKTRALAIVNNDYDEGLGQLLIRSRHDGGELTFYVAAEVTLGSLVRLLLGMVFGRWRAMPQLQRYPTQSLVITARRRRLRVMNDGEVVLLRPPLRYRIRPKALKVIVPASAPSKSPLASIDSLLRSDKVANLP